LPGADAQLVIMAAGVGSRYGGPKQLDRVGPAGETLVDYALFDARRAGFTGAVLVIRPALTDAFSDLVQHVPDRFKVSYVYQDPSRLPAGFRPPPRTAPWGTVHALLAARDAVSSPFATINADDFYGAAAYGVARTHCDAAQTGGTSAAVLLPLSRTLSEHGPVARAICRVGPDGWVRHIEEIENIRRDGAVLIGSADGAARVLDANDRASMNLWVFPPDIFDRLETWFAGFLRRHGDDPRAEARLPQAIGELLAAGEVRVRAVDSPSGWFGLTHAADRPNVVATLRDLHERGEYPTPLWNMEVGSR
jgi:hypothetical protein